jgi:hypothetical protein
MSETFRARRQHYAEAAVDALTETQRQMLSRPEASTRHGGA